MSYSSYMKTIILSALFILSSFANEAIRKNSYFNVVKVETSELATTQTNLINLVLVIDMDSKWTEIKLNEEIEKTQRSLQICDAQISSIEKVYVTLPMKTREQLNNQNPYAGPPELKIVLEGIPQKTMTGFLIDKYTRNGTAFAINRTSVERSERYPTLPSYAPMENTFWITDNFIPYNSAPGADKTYSTFAHEVVHIIGNLGHVENNPLPNLMGGNDAVGKSYALTQQQCDAILNYWF